MAGIVAGSTARSAGKSGGHGLPDLHPGPVRRALTDAGQNRFSVLLPRRDNPDATATLRTHDASKIRGVLLAFPLHGWATTGTFGGAGVDCQRAATTSFTAGWMVGQGAGPLQSGWQKTASYATSESIPSHTQCSVAFRRRCRIYQARAEMTSEHRSPPVGQPSKGSVGRAPSRQPRRVCR
jgi:hypothetical protein